MTDFAFGILLTFLQCQHEIESGYFEVRCQNMNPHLVVNKLWQYLLWSKFDILQGLFGEVQNILYTCSVGFYCRNVTTQFKRQSDVNIKGGKKLN